MLLRITVSRTTPVRLELWSLDMTRSFQKSFYERWICSWSSDFIIWTFSDSLSINYRELIKVFIVKFNNNRNYVIRHHDWRSSACLFRVGHTPAHQQLLFFARKTWVYSQYFAIWFWVSVNLRFFLTLFTRLLQQFIMEFHQFQQQLITKSFYQVHIEGNMTQKEATDIYKQITKLAQAKGPGSLKGSRNTR